MAQDLSLQILIQAQDQSAAVFEGISTSMQQVESVSQAVTQAMQALDLAQVNAASAANKVELAEAQAAVALQRYQEMASSTSTSEEQLALASAQATQAMINVNAAEIKAAQSATEASEAQNNLGKALQSEVQAAIEAAEAEQGYSTAATEASNASMLSGSSFLDMAGKVGMAVMGFQQFVQIAGSVGQALIGQNASMEQTRVAFVQLLGSSQAADAELQKLSDFAAATPFEFPELATATQKLLAFQIPLQNTQPLLTAIGDALSGLGKNSEASLEQVVDVFGQMNAAGKLQTQDLMQLTSVGINGFQLLADQMGKPVSVIKQMVTDGVIPAQQGIEMLRKGMEQTFGGGMQAQSETFNGLLSTLQDNANAALRAFTGPLFDAAKSGLTVLGNLVSSPAFQDFAKSTGQQIAAVFGKIASVVQGLAPLFVGMGNNWKEFAATLDTTGISAAFDGLVDAMKNFGTTIGPLLEPLLNNLDNLFISIAQLVSGLVAPALENLTQRIQGATTIAQPLTLGLSGIFNALQQVVDAITPVTTALGALVGQSQLMPVLFSLAAGAIGQIMSAISGLLTDIAKLITFFQQNQVAGDLLVAVLLTLAGAFVAIQVAPLIGAIGDLIAILPTLISFLSILVAGEAALAVETLIAMAPYLAIGALVAAVVAGIILAIQHWGEITTWLTDQWQRFATWFSGVWDGFSHLPGISQTITAIQSAWSNISGAAKTAWDKVTSTVSSAWSNISGKSQTTANNIGTWFQNAWSKVSSDAQKASGNIGTWFQNAWKNIQQTWSQSPFGQVGAALGPAIQKTLQEGLAPVRQQFSQLGSTIRTQLDQAFAGLKPALDNLKASFTDAWNSIVASAKSAGTQISGAWKTVQAALAPIGTFISGAFAQGWKTLQQALAPIGPMISGAFSGAWKSLQQTMSQLGQTLSTTLVPAWKTLQQNLSQIGSMLGGALGGAWKSLQQNLSQIGQLLSGILVPAWNTLSSALQKVGQLIQSALAPVLPGLLQALQAIGIVIGVVLLVAIGAILGLIVGLAQGFANLVTGLATVVTGVVQVFSGIVQIVSGIIAVIVDLFTGNFNKLGTDLGTIWTGIQTMFTGVWNVIKGLFQATIGTIVGFVSGFITTIVQFFQNLFDQLVGHSIIPDMLTAIVTAFTGFFTNVINGISTWIANVIQWFTQMWTNAQALFNQYLALVELALQTAWDTITTALQTAWNNIWAWIDNWWLTAQAYYKVYLAALELLLQTAWDTVSTDVQDAWNGIIDWLKSAATNIQDAIQTPFQNAIDFVKNLWNDLSSTVSNIVDGIKNKISDVLGQLSNAQNQSSSGSSGTVAGHASGGVNLPGGWRVVGEDGPELQWSPGGDTILPNSAYRALNTPASSSSSSGTLGAVNITINAPQRTQNEAKTITDAVSKELAKRYRLQLGTISMGGSNI